MKCHATVSILVLSALIGAVVQVTAVPASQTGTNALRRDFYGPEVLEAFLVDHDARAPRDQELLDDDQPRRIRPWSSQIRPGSTVFSVDEVNELSPIRSTRLLLGDRTLLEQFPKRNIDEIDRTAFDNFFKRNLGEIDRVGWNGFIKKLSDHLAAGRMGILERRG
ncbi:orcokinin peptides-like [Ceratina calcarata]|uniref:Orcokinin peptides-like n=1 Tax=Ceratina calcarata TaxID=156304 RepID=A0AAJ7IY65_9HYME|nr:orcokinin peptides-like [Ceratina calcarata]XP_026669260.1 orcokinin peptides-like [Ceratina calcarata]